jgi:CubicO group peptidase (beta-lactamase class C family)
VHRWLDGCPANWNSITVGHLLSHRAGLAHWLDLPGLVVVSSEETTDLTAITRQAVATAFPPPG